MSRCFALGLGILLLVSGCQGMNGPWVHKQNPVRVDDPHLTIDQQERLGRDRLAIQEMDSNIVPRTYTELPR